MNILIDLVPESVIIDNVEYEIRSDFRTSIIFESLMYDNSLSDEQKIVSALELYYVNCPHNIDQAIEKMLWFYRGGKDIVASKNKKNGGKSVNRIYDFEYDDDYIYAAFLDQYSIDLQDIDYLHWWKFKAMFKSLKEDNEIVKIMGYRSINLSEIDDKKERERYRKLKEMYDIPKSRDEIEKINEIEEALLNGNDLSNIL